jgi:hypothetical protein
MRAAHENPDLGARVERFAAEEARERTTSSRAVDTTRERDVSAGNGYTL